MQKQSFLSSNSDTSCVQYEKQHHYAQLEAVTATEGHLLHIAATGLGKARTIAKHLVRTVKDGTSVAPILLMAPAGNVGAHRRC